MYVVRLQRARVESQAHRLWLKTFVNGNYHNTWAFDLPKPQQFSTSRIHAEQKQPGPRRVVSEPAWSRREKQKQNLDVKQIVQLDALSVRQSLLDAVGNGDLNAAIALYENLPDKKPLTPEDFQIIAQGIHQGLREELYKDIRVRKRKDRDQIVSFATQLVKDVRSGRLLPSIPAHVHLLGIFRESGNRDLGINFWQWLEAQNEDFVSTKVYAAAIDLLAVNGSTLEELEGLYDNALARFPGNFHAYHLSPNAILPDRELPMVDVHNLPFSLLRAIIHARLLRGDSRRAYLALDTAFRLSPVVMTSRLLVTFADERPISEVYTIFAIACRAGIQLPVSHFKILLAKLRTISDFTSVKGHIAMLRAMIAATYFEIGASGAVPNNSVSEISIAMTQVLRVHGISSLEPKQRRKVVDIVFKAVARTLEVFARYGAVPTASIFNSVITNLAGFGRAKEVIGIALKDMATMDLEPNDVTRRSILTAAGLLGDQKLVLKTWDEIVDARQRNHTVPNGLDFHVLITAARRVKHVDFAKQEFKKYREHVHVKHHHNIEDSFDRPLDQVETITSAPLDELMTGVKNIIQDLEHVEEKTKDRPVVQDFSNQDLPMLLASNDNTLHIPDRELRKLYDEFTTDSSASLRAPAVQAELSEGRAATSTSVTNIAFADLRYENWKTFNHLLQLAEKHDRAFDEAVDKAIAAGVRPPKREMGITKEELEAMTSFGLSEVRVSMKRKAKPEDIEAAKKEIERLRRSV